MTTVFVLTCEMRVVGVYTTQNKARAEMNRQINEQVDWYARNLGDGRAQVAERHLKVAFEITEMEIQE